MVCVARDDEYEYPTPPEWRRAVLDEIEKRWGRGGQAELAKIIHCSPGTLNELLKNGRRSSLVPRIQKEFGWPPATMPATGSSDQHEIEKFLKKMGGSGRDLFRNLEKLDRDALKAAVAILEQLAKTRAND